MKSFLIPSLLATVVILSTASMCEDDDENENILSSVEATLGYGSWRVAYFFDQTDETSDFEGYVFQFQDDGKAIATKSGLTVPGSWQTEETSEDARKLYLDFGSTSPLEELKEDWMVTEFSGTRISLTHQSGGNGDTDTLTLERQ
jgi:hypothetical protein